MLEATCLALQESIVSHPNYPLDQGTLNCFRIIKSNHEEDQDLEDEYVWSNRN